MREAGGDLHNVPSLQKIVDGGGAITSRTKLNAPGHLFDIMIQH